MRGINFFALITLTLGALVPGFSVLDIKNSGSFSAVPPQAPTTTLRRIGVDRQTIAVLPKDKKYVVDLTQRGVVYKFNSGLGQIDYSRVMVRTARGKVAIGAFMKKIIPPGKLATFKYVSQSFSLGTRPAGLPNLPTGTSKILACGKVSCVCSGHDCFEMVFGGTFGGKEYCTGSILCSEDENGTMWCSCDKAQ